ncbi:MAG TPA: YncE family protein [Candidatus Eisenbacteria bacterium]|nr:YncE family protein [Candidatus Eisenbacteria bacterium]
MRFPHPLLACAAALAALAAVAAAAGPGYHVVSKLSPGGEGGWDYLSFDPAAHRLFVSRGTRVQVVDVDSGRLLAEVPDTPGVHGIALAPDLGRGFTSNGRDSTVTVFDLKTLATLQRVHVPARGPDAIVYDEASKRVFTFDGGSDDATAIDGASGVVAGGVPLGGRPEFAAADGKGRMYVNLEDSSAVVAFDSKTLGVLGRWPLAPGEGPSGFALDREHGRLFSGCHNQKLVVMDAANGHVVADLPIGQGVDAVAYDPGTHTVFSSNGDGTLTVIREDDPDHYTVLGNATTQRGARTMALDPKTHRVYLCTADFGEAPAATPDNPRPRRPMVPGSFVILVTEP